MRGTASHNVKLENVFVADAADCGAPAGRRVASCRST